MAKFPGGLFRGPLSSRVSRPASPDISLAGQEGRSLQSIGAGLDQLASGIKQYADRKERADAVAFKSSVMNKTIQDLSDFQDEAETAVQQKAKNDDEVTYKGLSSAVVTKLGELKEEALERAPSEMARKEVELEFNSLETRVRDKARAREIVLDTKLARVRRLNELETNRGKQFANPNLSVLNELIINGTKADIESERFDEQDLKRHQKLQTDIVKASVKGLIYKGGGSNLNEAEQFLDGKTNYNVSHRLLSEEDKAGLKEMVDRKRREELALNLAQGVSKAEDRLEAYKSDPTDSTKIERLGEDIAALEVGYAALDKPDLALRQNIDNFKAMVQSSDVLKTLPGKTSKEIGNIIKEVEAMPVEGKFDAKVKSARKALIQEYHNKMTEDPVDQMMLETSYKEGTLEMGEAIKKRGYAPRYYTNKTATAIEYSIQSHPGGLTQGLGDFMNSKEYGDVKVKTKFLNEVGFKSKKLATAALANIMPDFGAKKALLETDHSKVNSVFKDFGFKDSDVELMRNRLNNNTDFDLYRKAFTKNTKNLAYMEAMNDTVISQAKTLMTQGMSYQNAVDQAAQTMITNNIGFVTGSRYGDAYPIMGKYLTQDSIAKIQKFVHRTEFGINTKQFMDSLGVDHMVHFKNRDKMTVEEGLMRINLLNPKYEINKSLDGFIITIDDPANRSTRIPLNTTIKDSQGNEIPSPIEIPFDRILNPAEALYDLKVENIPEVETLQGLDLIGGRSLGGIGG